MHPQARGCIVIVHDEDGAYHMNCASFTPASKAEEHEDEMQRLVADAPKVARLWQEAIVKESRARKGQGQ